MRNALATLLALVPLAANAVVGATSTSRVVEDDAAWSFVGRMSGASAVAIGPRTVITAKHVGAGDFVLGSSVYRIASSVDAPKMKGAAVDLRIVQLRDMLPGWYQIGTSVAKKRALTMVGYGATGVANAEGTGYRITGGVGVRRAGTNVLASKATVSGRGPSLRAVLRQAGDAALAGGDSGGGWFVEGKLVGVSGFTYTNDRHKAAYGWARKAYFGSGAVDLTNSRVASWVDGNVFAGSRGLTAPAPEPGSVLALGVGAAGLLRRRSKRRCLARSSP